MRRVLASVVLAVALGWAVDAISAIDQPDLPAGPSTDPQPQPIWRVRIQL